MFLKNRLMIIIVFVLFIGCVSAPGKAMVDYDSMSKDELVKANKNFMTKPIKVKDIDGGHIVEINGRVDVIKENKTFFEKYVDYFVFIFCIFLVVVGFAVVYKLRNFIKVFK